jgi:transcriptional regulator with XRE-family HTH domain
MADNDPVATMHGVLERWVRNRIRLGETQEQVASHLGMSRTQLNQTISGTIPTGSQKPRRFQLENIEAAARAMDMALGEFLHSLGSLAVEIDTEERVAGQPVKDRSPRGVRVLADPETAALLTPSPDEPADEAPEPKPKRKPRR